MNDNLVAGIVELLWYASILCVMRECMSLALRLLDWLLGQRCYVPSIGCMCTWKGSV